MAVRLDLREARRPMHFAVIRGGLSSSRELYYIQALEPRIRGAEEFLTLTVVAEESRSTGRLPRRMSCDSFLFTEIRASERVHVLAPLLIASLRDCLTRLGGFDPAVSSGGVKYIQ